MSIKLVITNSVLSAVMAFGIVMQVEAAKPPRDNAPTASFTVAPNPVEPGAVATFDGSASSDDNGITGYCWDFGDGSAQDCSGVIVTHSYAAEGSYSATLTVTDTASQTGSASTTVTVEVDRLAALEALVADLQARLAAVESNSVLALDGKLTYSIDANGYDTAVFDSVNVQIVNGSGVEGEALYYNDVPNGLGNLIIGYNTAGSTQGCSSYRGIAAYDRVSCEASNFVWSNALATGSHNVVIGTGNSYSGFGNLVVGFGNFAGADGGIVSGEWNIIAGYGAAAVGGGYSLAGEDYASVFGGFDNHASGLFSTVAGSYRGEASGDDSAVFGAMSGVASGSRSAIFGGRSNTASGRDAVVSGGAGNTASGTDSTVSGGSNRTAAGPSDWAAGSLWEDF